ncbi:hypothetical protein HDV01_005726 [Terramyces sp. JEL0728]|nr:hypothetical protein HDV01_005726 [Terramyces sp. JEL0728]
MTELVELYLDSNTLPGTIFPDITKLTKLELLSLSNCNISGQIPPSIQQLSSLSTLYLDHNQLTGSIPQEIALITDLQWLDLSHNFLNPAVPSQIKQMKYYDANNFFFGNQTASPSQSGIGSGYVIIAVVVLVALGVAGVGYYLYNSKKNKQGVTNHFNQFPPSQPVVPNQAYAQPQQFQQPVQAYTQPFSPVQPQQTTFPNQQFANQQFANQQFANQQYGQQTPQTYPQQQYSPAQPVQNFSKDSPNQSLAAFNYSPQRQSFIGSPEQTVVGTNSPHGSQNSNQMASYLQPYQSEPAKVEIGQLPVLSTVPPITNTSEVTQPPVLGAVGLPQMYNHEVKVEDAGNAQPPILSKPF